MKFKNLLALISFFLSFFYSVIAQNNIEFYTGTSLKYGKSRSLNDALNSYKNYWKNNGEPNISLKTTNFNKEICYGLNFLIDHDGTEQYIIGFQHSNIRNEQVATLSTGKRYFKTIQSANIGYFGIRNIDAICYKFGIGITNNILQSSFEYPNGIRSFGMEKLSNGVYTSSFNMTLNVEVTKQKVFFDHLSVEAGIAIYGSIAGEYRDKKSWKV